MEIENALKVMASIDALENGTPERAVLVAALHLELLADPESFWEAFFETLNNLRPDSTRELAERLIRSGAVNGLTTIADIPAILADEYKSKEGNGR